ncbi:MAG: hypothetical protein SGPRY_009657 [Prymnesium sp.]
MPFTLLLPSLAFSHSQCFDAYGQPSGTSLGNGLSASLIQGFEFPDPLVARVQAPSIRFTQSLIDANVPSECFSASVSGSAALPHAADGLALLNLSSCAAGKTDEQMLRSCLSICASMIDLSCRAVQMVGSPTYSCQLYGEASSPDVAPDAGQQDPFALILATQRWRVCMEYPLRFLCSSRARSDNVYVGWLCLSEPIDPSKYLSNSSLPLPSEALPAPREWKMAFGMKLLLQSSQACADVKTTAASAVGALLPSVSNIAVECALATASCAPPCARLVAWLRIPEGSQDGVQALLDDELAMRRGWDALGVVGSALNVTLFEPSSWKLELPYRDGFFHDVPQCANAGASSGLRIAPGMTAVFFEHSEFRPEDHALISPFYKSQTHASDLYPIPDGCFSDTLKLGSPTNPAIPMGGAHYELLGADCAGNRTQEEMIRICMTICSKVDFGGPLQVDSRCVSVNFDEHGVGGHCHLQVASRLTTYGSEDCPRLLSNTVSRSGMCAKNDARTSRPLCNEGQLLQGVPPCVAGKGREQYVALFCFLTSDVGPSPGTGKAGCQLGEAYVGDGVSSNTLPTSTAVCSKCVAGSYSVPQEDTRLDRIAIPRPADFPSAINRCISCPPGRFCEQGIGCHYRALDEARFSALVGAEVECPPRCPKGHRCPSGSAAPIQCGQGSFQDERGQTTCKQCARHSFDAI